MKRRERLHRQPRRKFEWIPKFNIFKVLSIVLIAIFILLVPTVVKKLILIRSIECESQYGECPENIKAVFNAYESHDYKVTKDGLEKILNENNQISSYLIQYKIPSTLKIDINLKKPKYAIKDVNNRFYLIDGSGSVLEIASESGLPSLTKKDASYEVGKVIPETDKKALQIFEKTSLVVTIVSGTIENQTLKVTLDRGVLVYFPLDGDIDVLVGSLRLIFSRLNEDSQGIKMEDVREIDLRFANPVLR